MVIEDVYNSCSMQQKVGIRLTVYGVGGGWVSSGWMKLKSMPGTKTFYDIKIQN